MAYRILIVDESFAAATKLPVGMPLLHLADGSLCEPVVAYAYWRLRWDHADIGSVRAEVYAIREWVARCVAHRRSLWEPDDDALDAWRTAMLAGAGGRTLGGARTEVKLGFVFRFYAVLHRAMPWDEVGLPRQAIVVQAGAGGPGAGRLTGRLVGGAATWAFSKSVPTGWTPRPTPDPFEVRTILSRLRTPASGPGRRGADPELPILCAERNYCIGSLMAKAGFRADEAARFGMPALWEGLRAEGDLVPPDHLEDWRALDRIALEPAARGSLLDRVDGLKNTHRSTLYFRIVGKGTKERLVEFPVDLVRELLDVAVFDVRRRQLAKRESFESRGQAPPEVFLSFKTCGRLTSGAIGDIVATGFAGAHRIPGSTHRLRAYYATQTAIKIWGRCLSLNGGVVNVYAQELALEELRDALGHVHVTTTLRHYLSLAQFYHGRLAAGAPEMDALTGAVADLRRSMSPGRAALATRIVTALGASSDEELLCRGLALLLDRLGA